MKCLDLRNVEFRPYLPKERLAESLSAADLHLVPLLSSATGASVPSKLYGILAVGRPFVAMMERDADAAVLAEKHQAGFVVAPGDAEGLARTIRKATSIPAELKVMGIRARRLAEEHYDRKIVVRKFADAVAGPALYPEMISNGKVQPLALRESIFRHPHTSNKHSSPWIANVRRTGKKAGLAGASGERQDHSL